MSLVTIVRVYHLETRLVVLFLLGCRKGGGGGGDVAKSILNEMVSLHRKLILEVSTTIKLFGIKRSGLV